MNTKKILVTGGAGFVGRHLVKRLSENEENEITVIDNLSTGLPHDQYPKHLTCQVKHMLVGDCIEYFKTNNDYFDVIFHLAAIVEGRMTIEHNPLKVAKDLEIDAAMYEWAVRTNPGKIVYFSSSAAYPIEYQTKENHIALEESLVDIKKNKIQMPDMSYGWAKLTGEFLGYLAATKHNLNVAIYRPFSGYGEDQAFSYPFPSIIRRVIDSQGTIEVWGSGEQSRDFIHIEDCVTAILSTYEKIDDARPLNLGTGIQTTFKELIQTTCALLGKPCNIVPLLDKPEGVFARYCNNKKLTEYGFVPEITLEEGIKKTITYFNSLK